MNSADPIRYALVTGGGGALGRAYCLQLARAGWWVAVADINRAAGQETLAEIVAVGGRGQFEPLDVADPEAWRRLRERLRFEWPRLNLLINNAGVCASGEIGEGSLEDLQNVLDVNLMGVIYGCHTMVPWMKEGSPEGHVINVSSIATVLSAPAMSAYNVSKSGVLSYTETLFTELYGSGIGVTAVVPGFFPSGLLEEGRFSKRAHRQIAEAIGNSSDFSVDEVAAETLRAVQRKRLYVVLGRRARWFWRLKRIAPNWLLRIVAKQYSKRLSQFSESD